MEDAEEWTGYRNRWKDARAPLTQMTLERARYHTEAPLEIWFDVPAVHSEKKYRVVLKPRDGTFDMDCNCPRG